MWILVGSLNTVTLGITSSNIDTSPYLISNPPFCLFFPKLCFVSTENIYKCTQRNTVWGKICCFGLQHLIALKSIKRLVTVLFIRSLDFYARLAL